MREADSDAVLFYCFRHFCNLGRPRPYEYASNQFFAVHHCLGDVSVCFKDDISRVGVMLALEHVVMADGSAGEIWTAIHANKLQHSACILPLIRSNGELGIPCEGHV